MISPTYTATEILHLCQTLPVETSTMHILADILEEDLPLYSDDDMSVLLHASVVLLTRSLLYASAKINFGRTN